MEEEGRVTKRIAYGHYNRYNENGKYTTEIHPTRGPVVAEAHRLFDLEIGPGHLARIFNAKGYPVPEPRVNPEAAVKTSESNPETFEPVGNSSKPLKRKRAKLWQAYHFTKPSGLLRNEEAIGIFTLNRTRTITDPSSNNKMVMKRDESELIRVELPHLALVEKDRFYRNQDRIKARSRKSPKVDKPRIQAIQNRDLLTSCLSCSCCGANFHYATRGGKRVLFCGGTKQGSCENWAQVDARRLEEYVVDIVRQEIEVEDSLKIYVDAYTSALERNRHGFEHSLADLENQRELLKQSHSEALQAKVMTTGSEREGYVAEVERVGKKLRDIDSTIASYASTGLTGEIWKERAEDAKNILARLASHEALESGNWKDADTILTFRNCIKSAEHVPNSHDYAATIVLHMTYEHLFPEKPKDLPALESQYEIHIPGLRNTSRTAPGQSIDLEIVRDADRHRMSDEEWEALKSVLEPLAAMIQNGYLRRYWTVREVWDGICVRLKAGLSPASHRVAISNYTIVSLVARHLKSVGKWSAVLSALESAGADWIAKIRPELRQYLDEPIIPHNNAWIQKRIS
jgi:hypothetical protein